ncbi:CheR family methyltransferase [Desulfuromonas sp. DDH964]|uniref:CheR family methyltransferase n=1 Tax=Desulfuromonas sp. DDH964 TaxID=1823759 RepID=UPI00078BCA45|nr:CheR family methyltransferase [Desulfuromonas sp. DDH964]AMV70794.1 protein glutamate methyltransferase CheR associated with MCPs of class 40H [Desulfuromonas sp. DDH964]
MTSPLQVLIVDRDAELCQALSGLLEASGHRVRCLRGALTLSELRRQTPDLLLIDVPGAEGEEVDLLRRLSLQRSTLHLPIIVTANDPRLEFELLDVFDVLPKPLDEERLLEDLAQLAARRSPPGPYPGLTEVDLALFRDFLVTHSGLHFDRRNALLLERGLQRRMRALRSTGYRDYLGYLEANQESRQELKKLLGLLTIGETYFFRYLAHFELLREVIIPEVISRNRHNRSLRIWSAGCSTGEEPYSLAMLLHAQFPQLRDWRLEILGTDINKRSLAAARAGLYGGRALRATEAAYRDAYFRAEGSHFRIVPEIRAMVHFGYLNLRTGLYPGRAAAQPLDLIFCRNVMIYFQPETTQEIINRMAGVLRPGGYLLLGHAETLLNLRHDFARVQYGGGFVYRLPEPGAPPPPPSGNLAAPKIDPIVRRPVLPPPLPEPPSQAAGGGDQDPPDLAEIYARAVAAFDEENFKTASQNYAILLRHKPEHVGGLVGYGFLLANRGDYQEALEYCQRAQQVDDLYPESYFLMGLIREMEDNPEEALLEYRRALLLDMNLIMPHYALSRVFRRLGRLQEAAREVRNTLRLLERLPAGRKLVYAGSWTPQKLARECRRELEQYAGA